MPNGFPKFRVSPSLALPPSPVVTGDHPALHVLHAGLLDLHQGTLAQQSVVLRHQHLERHSGERSLGAIKMVDIYRKNVEKWWMYIEKIGK